MKAAPITCQAVLEPTPEQLVLLSAYGHAHGRALREVYLRCVIGQEPWFEKKTEGSCVRSALITRGWSQREATSLYKSAKAAQDAAVESCKLSLDVNRQRLERVQRKFEKAPTSRRHGLARRRSRLRSAIKKAEGLLANDAVRVCFGGQKTLRATREWEANGYATQAEAHDAWVRRRAGMIYVQGDREGAFGNGSLRVVLAENAGDGNGDTLRLRVPSFLRRFSAGAAEVTIPARGFAVKQGRGALRDATIRDPVVQAKRVNDWKTARAAVDTWDARLKTGEHGPAPKPATKHPPSVRCSRPVSVRLSWQENKQSWYVGATVERPETSPRSGLWRAVLGVDTNPDHLAWVLIDRAGNPLSSKLARGRIPLDLTGTAKQVQDNIGCAIAELTAISKRYEAQLDGPVCIAHERLDFKRARAGLRYCSPRLARLLSSFAYNQILRVLTHRALREGITTRAVSPAWTSVLGQANYACPYGVSVDQAAAVVIARRALGLRTRLRPTVSARLITQRGAQGQLTGEARDPACDGTRQGAASAALMHNDGSSTTSQLRAVAQQLRKRSTTWDKDGLARRNADDVDSVDVLAASASRAILLPGASISSALKPVLDGSTATGSQHRWRTTRVTTTETHEASTPVTTTGARRVVERLPLPTTK